MIDWENTKVVDRESNKADRLIREAIWIRKTGDMNRDEGSYQLSHVWDKLLRPVSEVSPDEGCRREAETSINSTLFWLY